MRCVETAFSVISVSVTMVVFFSFVLAAPLSAAVSESGEASSEMWIHEKTVDLKDTPDRDLPTPAEPQNTANDAASNTGKPWYLTEPFFTGRVGVGYVHPSLDISRRYGPSIAMEMTASFWGKRLGLGIFVMPIMDVSSKRQFDLAASQTKNGEPANVTGRPMVASFGMSLGVVLLKQPRWFIDAQLGIGINMYQYVFNQKENKNIYS